MKDIITHLGTYIVKKLSLILSLLVILSYSSFADEKLMNPSRGRNGFVFSFIGGGSMPHQSFTSDNFAGNAFSYLQPGFLMSFGNGFGISALFNIGYNISVDPQINDNISNIDVESSINIHSADLGITVAFNIKDFMLGLSGGIKIPIDGSAYVTTLGGDNNSFDSSTTQSKIRDKIEMTQYLKLSADYLFFVDTKTAITLGLNIGYDFEMKEDRMFYASKKGFSFGGQVGLRFGPRL